MKLTKGKISKLYNKKRQSFKKNINKKRSASKRKTFRKNKKFNLAKKTLRRYNSKKRGGEGPNEDPKVENEPVVSESVVTPDPSAPAAETVVSEEVVAPAAETVTEEVVAPAAETVTEEVVPATKVDVNELPDTSGSNEELSEPSTASGDAPPVTGEDVPITKVDVNELPNTSAATEGLSEPSTASGDAPPVTGEDVPVTKVDVNTLPDTSAANEGLSEPSPPPTFEPTSAVQDEQKETTNISVSEEEGQQVQQVQQGQNPSEITPQVEENTGASVKSEQEIDIPSPQSDKGQKINNAIKILADALSEEVAKKVILKEDAISSGKQVQDGFESVATAAETMSGGKKNKSRKFRLTNKRKSRKHKK